MAWFGVEGHATSVSWRPPRWARPQARYTSAYTAFAVADRPRASGRARGGCQCPRGLGGAWLLPADRAPRELTATAWNCCGERTRPALGKRSAVQPEGAPLGAAGLRAARASGPASFSRSSACALGLALGEGLWGSEATGTLTWVTKLW